METWKRYQRDVPHLIVTEARPYVPGENLQEDSYVWIPPKYTPQAGDWILRNPKLPRDRALMPGFIFQRYYKEV